MASLPLRDYGWDQERVLEPAETLLRTGRLRHDGLVDPIMPFEVAPDAYRRIDSDPEWSVKLGVRFGG